MPMRIVYTLLLSATLAAVPATAGPKAEPRGGEAAQAQPALSAEQAAAKARARHGGKVLKISRQGRGYRVKLLLDSGRVKSVTIKE